MVAVDNPALWRLEELKLLCDLPFVSLLMNVVLNIQLDIVPTAHVAAKGSIPIYQVHDDVCQNKKRKCDGHHTDSNKKHKTQHAVEENIHKFTSFEYGSDESHTSLLTGNVPVPPQGLIWDGANYSCAYDAFFSILRHLWRQDPPHWTQQFQMFHPHFMA
jgi:hypothetical protein